MLSSLTVELTTNLYFGGLDVEVTIDDLAVPLSIADAAAPPDAGFSLNL